MAIIRLQTELEKRKGIFYQFDTDMPPIGEGGMGKVCEGLCVNEQNGFTRPVAIKFMFDDLPLSAYERARREAEIQLRNDNLVEMLGFIETQDVSPTGEVRRHYHVISELLTGVSLSDILEGKTKDRTGEDVPYAVKMLQDYQNDPEHFAQIIVINVLSGLMALHDAGYIHRDIDPSNIMLTTDGHIKLIDFGIAKQMNTLTTGDKSLTVAGKFMGKPEYAAPELVLGDFIRNIIATACEKKQELRYQTSSQMRVALETMNGSKRAMTTKIKITLVAIAAAVIFALFSIALIVKHKQNVARQEAEMARVEQQHQEVLYVITSLVEEADRLRRLGMSKEEDNYEQLLMDAFSSYSKAERKAIQNKTLAYSTDEIESRKNDIFIALDSAKSELARQASLLLEMGEEEMANSYSERVKVVENFMNANRKKDGN